MGLKGPISWSLWLQASEYCDLIIDGFKVKECMSRRDDVMNENGDAQGKGDCEFCHISRRSKM
jgi:hypothetical protein